MPSDAPLIADSATADPISPRSPLRALWVHAFSLWVFVARLADPSAYPATNETESSTESARRSRSRPFSGHTFAEAGLSSWVPPVILGGLRAGFALGLMALTMAIALTSDWRTGARVLLTTSFWGPLTQAVAFLLLSACSLRMELAAAVPDSGWLARLPDIAVPLHQMGSAIALFSPVASIALRGPLACIFGAVTLVFFLVDTIVLDAQVRFRLQYVLLPFVFFIPGAISNIIHELVRGDPYLENMFVLLLVLFGLALLQIVCGIVVTLLTRIVEMRSRKRTGSGASVAYEVVETLDDDTV